MAALALAAVIGVSGGAVTAFFAQDDETVAARPLGLGILMENVDCTGETLILVAVGDTRAALRPRSATPTTSTSRPRPDESCDTAYPRREGTYAAYLAYPSLEAACAARMTNVHKDDVATWMRVMNVYEDAASWTGRHFPNR